MSEIIMTDDSGVALLPELGVAISPTRSREATRPVKIHDTHYSGEYIPWGADNMHPQNTIITLEENDVLPGVIDWKTRALMSGGLMYGDITTDEQGTERYLPMRITEIDEFFERVEIDNYLQEAIVDFYTHANIFPEIILNVNRQAVGLHCNDAAFCRFGRINKEGGRKGLIDTVFVGADWEYTYSIGHTEAIAAVDPYEAVVDQIRQGKLYKYIVPTRAQSRGRLDYQKGPVEYLIASGWLDIAKEIPQWIKALMSNQLVVKYHVQVSTEYWKIRWPDWDSFKAQKMQELKRKAYNEFAEFFKGMKKGNSLVTEMKWDPHKFQNAELWKVTVVENKVLGDSAYIEQSTQSDYHIIRSQGVDPAVYGYTPGKGFTAGSGSDKRVALNQYIMLMQPEQRKLLRPLDYIADLNNWHKYGKEGRRLKFWFKNLFVATLDNGKPMKDANSQDTSKT